MKLIEFWGLVVAVVFSCGIAEAQSVSSAEQGSPSESVALPRCALPKSTVKIVEESAESTARLEETGLPGSVLPLVKELLLQSNCYTLSLDAALTLNVVVTGILDERTPNGAKLFMLGSLSNRGIVDERDITITTSLTLKSDKAIAQSTGKSSLNVIVNVIPNNRLYVVTNPTGIRPKGLRRQDAYNLALESALADALKKIVESQP